MVNWKVWLTLLWLGSWMGASAQNEEVAESYPVNVGTMAGVGGYNLMDTYLTPGIEARYTGWGVRILDERIRQLPQTAGLWTRQQLIDLSFARTQNGAGSAIDYGFLLNYQLGYLYRLPLSCPVNWQAGLSGELLGGCIYNTRNTNNPVAAKADLSANLTTQVAYTLRLGSYPMRLRYQCTLPFLGMAFAPHYNQSYYEMFGLGNHAGVVHLVSFHNKFAMRHYLTVDLPVGPCIVRVGYLSSRYRTDINEIRSHLISNSFVVGLVKEFVASGSRSMRHPKSHSMYD